MSFGNLLDWTASRLPDKVALIGGDKRVSYAALNLLTRRAAAGLAAAGMRAGEGRPAHVEPHRGRRFVFCLCSARRRRSRKNELQFASLQPPIAVGNTSRSRCKFIYFRRPASRGRGLPSGVQTAVQALQGTRLLQDGRPL